MGYNLSGGQVGDSGLGEEKLGQLQMWPEEGAVLSFCTWDPVSVLF